MDAEHFGDGLFSSSLAGYKQVSDGREGVCRCRNPLCQRLHYQNEDGTAGPWEIPVPTAIETWFRHFEWRIDRAKVIEAFPRAGVPAKRLERFKACGASAYVEFCPASGRHRVRGFYCGDRFCRPCSRSRAARGRRAISLLAAGRELRFLTFSRASVGESLTDAIDHLFRCFRKMRTHDSFRQHVDGGVGVIEIKRGKREDHWHVHFHCLCTGLRWEQAEFSQTWLWATGDSPVVDIRFIYDEEQGAGYVCKYLGKGFDASVLRDADSLVECISALSGRRLLVTFGSWYGRLKSVEREPRREWKMVGGLQTILLAAERGEEWAAGALRSLRAGRDVSQERTRDRARKTGGAGS